MKIALSCETTVDLPKSMLEEFNIHTIPFTIVFGDEMVPDGDGVAQRIFDYFDAKKELANTTALNEYQYAEYFGRRKMRCCCESNSWTGCHRHSCKYRRHKMVWCCG